MKWVFYLLVMINIAYFAWQRGHVEPSPAASPEAPKLVLPAQVERLLLFDEVDPDSLELRAAAASPAERRKSISPAASKTALKPPSEPTVEPAAESKPATRVAKTQQKLEKEGIPLCRKIGPLPRKTKPDAVKAWLKGRGITTISRTEQHKVLLHWVYFPPYKTLAEANEYADRLKEDGVKDIYVLPKGGMQRAISVGIFSKRSSLEKRVADLRKKGYTPAVGSRLRTEKATWLHTVSSTKATFPETNFGRKFPLLAVARTACGN
uniref:Sporulation related domain-containing protein n=1 Tax=Candidatus Kentrum sp. LPFa TaxID=2126335 RepID=A0A450VT55_9GAMM|nr:MAG: hypothetical protein BECKLPF1236A_GA0070988_100126 [Candidatus Kentron sp. LPFa]VFK25756.1 MAG: hypothetical protein BECKLPF1236C_GA0070990_100252 [Candidatus Kentron sp. LPFa]